MATILWLLSEKCRSSFSYRFRLKVPSIESSWVFLIFQWCNSLTHCYRRCTFQMLFTFDRFFSLFCWIVDAWPKCDRCRGEAYITIHISNKHISKYNTYLGRHTHINSCCVYKTHYIKWTHLSHSLFDEQFAILMLEFVNDC